MPDSSRLPDLGARGGGWVAGQFVLLLAIALSALIEVGWPKSVHTAMHVVGILVMCAGLALLAAGAVGLGSALTPFPRPRAGGSLRVAGVYARARHPIYGGAILLAAGWSLFFATPLGGALTLVLVLFFELKARREEHWLVERYPDYAAYRSRTRKRYVPYVF
jgi:protein-S-isoprenylcysteine O-methyltransferase Ste14